MGWKGNVTYAYYLAAGRLGMGVKKGGDYLRK